MTKLDRLLTYAVRPIDDPDTAIGSWDTIEKLLGTDIRKERELL